ncbi:MAG: NAD(P)/FAD-dependent oxidoreductase [Burkholderiales bacterium]|nr:NAD(P)/FAD-dependent oxidoreductase [Burkholderiales bacterium]
MMTAAVAAQRGLRVVLIDHAERLAEKIRISGGGRCNFTNLGASPTQFLSRNPDFCRSALRAYGPGDFLDLLRAHRVSWHEKHRGQLFCDDSSESIIQVLRRECEAGGVRWRMPCAVRAVAREADGFRLDTDSGPIRAARLVLATGGMAIPQLGATDFSLRIARQFGLRIVEPRPALVPLTFDAEQWRPYAALAGVSLEVRLSHEAAAPGGGGKRSRRPMRAEFLEDLLFTHRGLSGPAILQVSSYWREGDAIAVDLLPDVDIAAALKTARTQTPKLALQTVLAAHLPRRLAQMLAEDLALPGMLGDFSDRKIALVADTLHRWTQKPTGSEGYRTAEVTLGGVDTASLNSTTMAARDVPGLYVIGEVVDVTGWLGGYNFQWAWASGWAAGQVA